MPAIESISVVCVLRRGFFGSVAAAVHDAMSRSCPLRPPLIRYLEVHSLHSMRPRVSFRHESAASERSNQMPLPRRHDMERRKPGARRHPSPSGRPSPFPEVWSPYTLSNTGDTPSSAPVATTYSDGSEADYSSADSGVWDARPLTEGLPLYVAMRVPGMRFVEILSPVESPCCFYRSYASAIAALGPLDDMPAHETVIVVKYVVCAGSTPTVAYLKDHPEAFERLIERFLRVHGSRAVPASASKRMIATGRSYAGVSLAPQPGSNAHPPRDKESDGLITARRMQRGGPDETVPPGRTASSSSSSWGGTEASARPQTGVRALNPSLESALHSPRAVLLFQRMVSCGLGGWYGPLESLRRSAPWLAVGPASRDEAGENGHGRVPPSSSDKEEAEAEKPATAGEENVMLLLQPHLHVVPHRIMVHGLSSDEFRFLVTAMRDATPQREVLTEALRREGVDGILSTGAKDDCAVAVGHRLPLTLRMDSTLRNLRAQVETRRPDLCEWAHWELWIGNVCYPLRGAQNSSPTEEKASSAQVVRKTVADLGLPRGEELEVVLRVTGAEEKSSAKDGKGKPAKGGGKKGKR